MKPARYNFEIWRGAVKDFDIRFPINLFGCTAAIYYLDTSLVRQSIPLTVEEVTASPVKWAAKATVSQTATRDFPLGKRIPYELQVKTVDNKDYIYLYGELIIQGGINGD